MKKTAAVSMVVLLTAYTDATALVRGYCVDMARLDAWRDVAGRTGCRLEIAPDAREAMFLEDSPWPEPGWSRSIPIDTTPAWSSSEDYAVGGLCWCDVDGDGDLDLISAHYEGGYPVRPEQTRIWFNSGSTLESSAGWVGTDAQWSTDVTAGDIDGDGDFDLAVADWGTNVIHGHNGVTLETAPSWVSSEGLFSLSAVLGDVSGAAAPVYLELFIANQAVYPDPGQPNHLYDNSAGIPVPSASWTSGDIAQNMAAALGDYDEDGVSGVLVPWTGDGVRRCFSTGALLPIHSVVSVSVDSSPVQNFSVQYSGGWLLLRQPPAAGAVILMACERSTDLDAAVAVDHGNAKVYNDLGETYEGTPSFVVSGTGDRREKGVAWVDVDGDGDLDLFVGGRDVPMHLYENVAGVLSTTASWSSDDTGPDLSDLDWIDVDGDGDLDLATSNTTKAPVFRIYENLDGTLETTPSWGLPWSGSMANAVAWGDMNNDGWPDLAVAYAGAPIQVYLNTS
ncbi:VCBS repeat-containing protein, partial [bacterium]|nr:VCBS repeat-containing protein [candidate division CSSED10-310 bacterium]